MGGGRMKLRYAKPDETKCMMILKDGTKFEVPIMREDDDERS
jgi:hypothetical protein